MSTEASSAVRRAALHAALGDPGRLTIVDTLAWGEASPGELGARLGMTSNLLAHHLRVLEEGGLVTRHRSEGDRRRSYVALARDVLDLLVPTSPALVAERVVFVCTHNSARSQLAAAMWNDHSPVPATSAGTHPAPRVHPGAVAVARRRHLALVPAPPRHVHDVLDPADLVVTVCDSAHEELATGSTGVPVGRPGLHWSIPDPVTADDPAAFDTVVDELTDRITRLTPAVHAIPDPKDQERSS
jgi:protein-tyrosine-phosphatase/DNA-binding HxlR family transcriptional regulator